MNPVFPALKVFDQSLCTLLHAGAVFTPGFLNRRDQLQETRPIKALTRWKIGSSIKWLSIRQQECREWPPPSTRHRSHRVHVNLVHMGLIFTIHLDGNEMCIQKSGNRRIGKRLPAHHMTPVAAGISDRQKHRAIEIAGGLKGLIAPSPPLHRIFGMFSQIGTRTVPQSPTTGLGIATRFAIESHCIQCRHHDQDHLSSRPSKQLTEVVLFQEQFIPRAD